eukprot:scaffold70763_cov32-Tisochrysis_lutea.AAC.7
MGAVFGLVSGFWAPEGYANAKRPKFVAALARRRPSGASMTKPSSAALPRPQTTPKLFLLFARFTPESVLRV